MANGKTKISKTIANNSSGKAKKKTTRRKTKDDPVYERALERGQLIAGIIKELRTIVSKDKNLYLAFINDDFAFLIKKKQVSVNKVVNPDSMQPYEKNENQTFFDCFVLEWGNDKAKHAAFGKLVDMGIMSYKIISPMVLEYVVREA